ncbi:PITH domain-containing protein 1-like [Octopus sinensis]|uniref:PITH domain-containing protein 1-like n=1 Tax=Octopus sinensis TaxID=2607531 RepID=A0A7E6EID3_9MOLL|nr:PITH domain-containing protein 1-like [Octopus sinensis]
MHNHSGGCCCGEKSNSGQEEGYSLYQRIDFTSLICLNEKRRGTGRTVFKPYEQRHSPDYVESDVDPELLFSFSRVSQLGVGHALRGSRQSPSLQTQNVSTTLSGSYKNVTFTNFGRIPPKADVEFVVGNSANEVMVFNTSTTQQMKNITSLSLYFPENYGAESTRIYYIGLKGQFDRLNRPGILLYNYELTPNPSDVSSPVDSAVDKTIF